MSKKNTQPAPEEAKAPRGRYRKVEVRTWGDAKFRELTPIPPCGQGLWLFLITGPHTGPIPGLFRAGRAAMAEELGWELEDFDKAFQEALSRGMVEADFKARVVWVPKAINHNRPESPNVVKSWGSEFDLIPECDLKWKAFDVLKASIHAVGEAFGQAFDAFFKKPSAKPSEKAKANQEQEQEQEQKQEEEPTASSPAKLPTCQAQKVIDLYHEVLPEMPRVRLHTRDRTRALAKAWVWVLTSTKEDDSRRAETAEEALGWFREYFARARDNDFLMRRNAPTGEHANWRCDLDFLLTDKGMKHVIEKTEVMA